MTNLKEFDASSHRGEEYAEPVWSPDGKWIMAVHVRPGLLGAGNRIVIIDPQTGREVQELFEGAAPDWYAEK